MARAFPLLLISFILLSFQSFVSAASSAESFCKCICGANSTIISLNARRPAGDASDSTPSQRTCNDCNRQFCLDYRFPICRETKDEDISTECFQRDSTKDKAVVYTFILLTVGLLVYAAFRPWIDSGFVELKERRQSYMPVASSQGNG